MMHGQYNKKVVIFAIILVAVAFFFVSVATTGNYARVYGEQQFNIPSPERCAPGSVGIIFSSPPALKDNSKYYWACNEHGEKEVHYCLVGEPKQRIHHAQGRIYRSIECEFSYIQR